MNKNLLVKTTVTIHLTEDDVKNIVADYLVSQGYKVSSDDVKLLVTTEMRGYGLGEYMAACFKECEVTVVSKGD